MEIEEMPSTHTYKDIFNEHHIIEHNLLSDYNDNHVQNVQRQIFKKRMFLEGNPQVMHKRCRTSQG